MKRFALALFILCSSCAIAHAQSLVRKEPAPSQIIEDVSADQVVAARAIILLKRLNDDVIVYRSLQEFEEGGKLARVSFETFRNTLTEMNSELQSLISRLPNTRLKADLGNAFASYQDGAYWWEKISEPRVVHVSKLATGADAGDPFFAASIPYFVAIHWRQANKYLQRALRDLGV